MYASLYEVQKINEVQIEILRNVAEVCDKIGVEYFLVHGSLLGAVRNEGFIPYDDDIDIAMKRGEYEKFLKESPKYLRKEYFVQSINSDPNYPLSFAKVRDCNTTYICEAVKNIDMNHGVYIDVFPIDNANCDLITNVVRKFLNVRISECFTQSHKTMKTQCRQIIAKLLVPSIKKAVYLREKINTCGKKNGFYCITGGKPSEEKIPMEWFDGVLRASFEEIDVCIPIGFDHYLRCIYGDYENRTLVEGKMLEKKVELNASVVDLEKPYVYYFQKRQKD